MKPFRVGTAGLPIAATPVLALGAPQAHAHPFSPFNFTGTVNKLAINLGDHQLTVGERETMQAAVANARDQART